MKVSAKHVWLILLVLLWGSWRDGWGYENLLPDEALDSASVDEDSSFMGEYLGNVAVDAQRPLGPRHSLGLQVVPLGDGQFSAMSYRGGLPGNGWDGMVRDRWQGQREGPLLTLRKDNQQIRVQAARAMVLDEQQTVVGTLPKVVRRSATLGALPPAWSIALFDGQDVRAFKDARVIAHRLQAGTELVPCYRDYTIHLEFRVPYMPRARGQGRGNSGVYLQSRYEVQILDSFGLEGLSNECGGLYRYLAPLQNMAFPPLSWQTYDITFCSPRFDATGRKTQDARLTVLHNGVMVHNHVRVEHKTGAGRPEGPELLPIKLQDHGNPVEFRNIWLVEHAVGAVRPRSDSHSGRARYRFR